jgi:hypothetical protein
MSSLASNLSLLLVFLFLYANPLYLIYGGPNLQHAIWSEGNQVSISTTFYARVFLYKSALYSFSLNTFWLHNFLVRGNLQKIACKMLTKLTTGADPTKIYLLSDQLYFCFYATNLDHFAVPAHTFFLMLQTLKHNSAKKV